MIIKSRKNATKNGLNNIAEFRLGEIEYLPVADGIVDVIISNCVLNLSTNKNQVYARQLRQRYGEKFKIFFSKPRYIERHSAYLKAKDV